MRETMAVEWAFALGMGLLAVLIFVFRDNGGDDADSVHVKTKPIARGGSAGALSRSETRASSPRDTGGSESAGDGATDSEPTDSIDDSADAVDDATDDLP